MDLFEPDEFDSLTMELKTDAYAIGMSDTPTQLREFFYQVKENLSSIVIDFSFVIACPSESTHHSLILSCWS